MINEVQETKKKNWLICNLANIITGCRIVGTIFMIFCKTLSKGFFWSYSIAGLTDAVDGTVARATKSESDFGRVLDSIADLLMFTSMMIKIIPYLKMYLYKFLWKVIWGIVFIRVALYFYHWLKTGELLSNHTYLNKATGFFLFFVPYVIKADFFNIYASVVCSIAALAAIYELVFYVIKPIENKNKIGG